MKSIHKASIFVAILFFLASSLGMGWLGGALAKTNVVGAVPSVVSCQGYLNGAGGLPYNGIADFVFSIYGAETGGSELWTESHSSVTVSNGYFTVLLGIDSLPVISYYDEQSGLSVIHYNDLLCAP